MEQRVYELYHIHEIVDDEEENMKFLGVYSSLLQVHNAITVYSKLPGFRNQREIFWVDDDYEAGFLIAGNTIGDSDWKEGYADGKELMESLYGTVFTEEEDANLLIDIPFWSIGAHPHDKESSDAFAKRLMQTQYGDKLYPQGPESEFFQIKQLFEANNFNVPHSSELEQRDANSKTLEAFRSTKDTEEVRFIYLVHHLNPTNDDVKGIGIYSSLAEAEAIVARYKGYAGFRDTPSGFYIDAYELDKPYWTGGYHSVLVSP